MHTAALLAHLDAAWSRKPHSVALLTPLGAGTATWTFQDVSGRVSPAWPSSVGAQPQYYCLTNHTPIMTGGHAQPMDTPDNRWLEASGAGRQSHSGAFNGNWGAIHADRPQLPACWVNLLPAWPLCNAVGWCKQDCCVHPSVMAMVKVLTPAFFWSSPEITWLLSSQGGIHAAGPLMARPHSEGRC